MKLFFRITFKICLIFAIFIGCDFIESELLFNQGNALFWEGEYDQAIVYFNKTIEINPKNAEAYDKRGFCYANWGQYDKAISDYTKSIEIYPRDAWTHNNRGLAYYYKSQYDKACSDLKRACELGNCKGLKFVKRDGYCK